MRLTRTRCCAAEARNVPDCRLRILCAAVVCVGLAFLAGCGHVRTKVTATPVPPTLTALVHLSMPVRRATSTPVPSTPLPTATPTPTPTPIVHVVAEGDLLLHIASQYDVSMQAIIEANQIVNPHSLPIGLELIIPRSKEEALALRPTATPTPMPLQVIHSGFHRTPTGSLWCMGEVENERDEALDLVQLQVSLYNAGGELLDRAAAFTLSDVVPGHGVAPFAVLLPGAPAGGFARYEIEVLSAEPVAVWGRRHRALTVEALQGAMKEGTLFVSGAVRNRGQENAAGVRVIVTAYGEDETVVGVRQLDVDPVPAGVEYAFTLTIIPAAHAVRVEAVAWGMKEAN